MTKQEGLSVLFIFSFQSCFSHACPELMCCVPVGHGGAGARAQSEESARGAAAGNVNKLFISDPHLPLPSIKLP